MRDCASVIAVEQKPKREPARALYVLYSLAFTFVFLHCSAKNNDAASVEAWAMTSK